MIMKKKILKANSIDLLLGILLCLIVILIFIQVLFRYLLNNSLNWTEELAKYLFIWMIFIGAACVFKDKIHIGVDFFVSLLPLKYQRYMHVVDLVLITLFSACSAVIGYMWTIDVWGTLSPALELPIALLLYAAFPTSSAIICILGIMQLAHKDTEPLSKKEDMI
jgi:TRAP-type C4-dicarboxylate transport system permease small subunit